MLSNFLLVAEQVGVLFVLMGVGFFLGKINWLDRQCIAQMSRLLIYVIAPSALINALQITYDPQIVSSFLWGCFFLIFQYIALVAISQFTFRKKVPTCRSVLRFAQVYANNIFMGMPLLQTTLGNEAAVFIVPSLTIFQIFQWTHGVSIMGGKLSLKRAILNPGILGIVIGFTLFMARITLPVILGNAITFLASMNTPLAMIIIGVQMAEANFCTTFTRPCLYCVSTVRLLVSPIVTLLVMLPFRQIDSALFCALIILSAAPTAGVTSIFAQEHQQDTATAAQVTTLSTLLSLISLPIFAALTQTLTA